MDDLSNKISTNISSLGVDSSTNAAEHGNAGASQAVASDAISQDVPLAGIRVSSLENLEGNPEDKHAKSTESKSHDRSSAEGSVEAGGPAGLLGGDGGANVTVDGNLHAEVAADHGGDSSQNKGSAGEGSTGPVVSSIVDEEEDQGAKSSDKVEADGVLSPEEALGSLVDGSVDLNQPLRGGFLRDTAVNIGGQRVSG